VEDYILWFDQLGMDDVERVGGKNASLGEMISNLSGAGVTVPGGFATTAHAYREFLAHEGLNERINQALARLDVDDVSELARVGAQIRQWVIDTPLPPTFETHLRSAYDQTCQPASQPQGGGAQFGYRRGPAGRFIRRAAGDLPQHRGLRQRQACRARGVRLAVQ
jgi:phosphoenolpyruvate synthase/pyruvate phosphate dikinase